MSNKLFAASLAAIYIGGIATGISVTLLVLI